MEVRFSLTPQDVYYYHRFGYHHLLWFQLFALMILAGALVAAVGWLLPFPALAGVPLLLRLPVLLALPIFLALYKPLLLGQARGIAELKGDHRLLLNPTGCSYQSWRGDLWIPWYRVTAIEQDERSLYFILKGSGPLYQYGFGKRLAKLLLDRVCIVPQRSFANPLEAATFLDQARLLWGNALPPRPEAGFGKRIA